MRSRSVLLLAPALVAGSLITLTTAATAGVPSGASSVSVTSNTNHQNINAHLKKAAAIKGKVTNSAGHAVANASVVAFKNGRVAAFSGTNSSGAYTVRGLLAGTYKVCATGPFSGGPSAGYLGSCYGGGFFGNSFTVPSSAAKIVLSNGQLKTGKNIKLKVGAAISGKITSPSGAAIKYGEVAAHNRSTGATVYGGTDKYGKYKIKSLPPSTKGYTVCASAPFFGQPGKTGVLPRCYKKTAWSGGSSYPSTATKVSVKTGKTTTGISVRLTAGGAISGTISDASNGHPLSDEGVVVFNSSGRFLAFANTNSQGHYVAKGLAAASGDRVCAYPHYRSATVHYKGKCWKNVAWNGGSLPKGTTGVAVHVGKIHTGVNLKLTKVTIKVGSISGTITEAAGASPLQNAEIDVFTSGGAEVGGTETATNGTYTVSNLPVNSTGYVVCAKTNDSTFSGTTATPNPGGWAPRCYKVSTGTAWNGVNVPSGATRLSISAGQHRSGIDIALQVGGEISGNLFIGAGPATASNITVFLFTSGGKEITESGFQSGTYSFSGLAPEFSYKVCFDGREDGSPSIQGYRPQCYSTGGGVEWNGTI